jgi:hypothetical protein
MTSSHIITSNLVMAFCLCKRKAFLLSRGDTGEPPHEYLQLINARATANQNTYLNSLSAAGFQVHQDCIGGITTSVDGSDHKRRGGTKGHQAFHRIVPTKVGKVIRVRRPMKCARHKGQVLIPSEKVVEHTVIDLVFTKNGCRKPVTRYIGAKGYCPQCQCYYAPPGIRRFQGRLFGHCFRAWVVYQRVTLRLPYSMISQVIDDLFCEQISKGSIVNFIIDPKLPVVFVGILRY